MNTTKHAEARKRQRGIPDNVVELIIENGTPRPRPGGAEEYVVMKADRDRIVSYLKQLIRLVDATTGKGVLVSAEGTIITNYHLTL